MEPLDIQGFFEQLFTALNTEDSILIIVFLFVAWLLGLIIGRWTKGPKIRRLKKELKAKEAELINVRAEQAKLQEEMELIKADMAKLTLERDDLQKSNQEYAAQESKMRNSLVAYKEELDQYHRDDQEQKTRIIALQNRIAELEANPSVEQEIAIDPQSFQNMNSLQALQQETNNRLALLEAKLVALETKNVQLEAAMAGATPNESGEKTVLYSDGQHVNTARLGVAQAIGGQLPLANAEDKDDLQAIDGIGPFIEQKLNDLGIYTFEQITHFDEQIIEEVTDAIQFFPGRIQKDDWVGQAWELMQESDERG